MPTCGSISPPNLSSPESSVSVQSLSTVMVLRSIAALPEARVSAAFDRDVLEANSAGGDGE